MSNEDETTRLINRLRQYRGFVFRWQAYKRLSPEWSHDHCVGCWARFAERPEEWSDAVHTEGWVTVWPRRGSNEEEPEFIKQCRAAAMLVVPYPKINGDQLDWMCPKCFEACRHELAFVIASENPESHKDI